MSEFNVLVFVVKRLGHTSRDRWDFYCNFALPAATNDSYGYRVEARFAYAIHHHHHHHHHQIA